MKNLLLIAVIGLVAAGLGFALPMVLGGASAAKPPGTSRGESGAATSAEAEPVFVSFGEVVVNVNEERLSKYLRVVIMLVVDGSHEAELRAALEKQKPFLKNWLISYLSDKTPEQIRSAENINRARREIQDQFNATLFPDGSDKIQDVLFEEFSVQ